MGTIKKFVNGSFSEDFGEFSGNMFGQPFLCVYGKTKQRILPNADIVEWTLCEGLKSYIRFMPSKELKRHLSGKEGADVDGSIVLTKQIAELMNMVHQVNASEVTEKDQLSDSVFAYDAEGLHQA